MSGRALYTPLPVEVAEVRDEAPSVRSLIMQFGEEQDAAAFDYGPGQFVMVSAYGAGECTFCLASSPTEEGQIQCTFRRAGRVTSALWDVEVGDALGLRGPYGNGFPINEWRGKNLVFVAGGIGLPPLRSAIAYCLDRREEFDKLTIVYGARTVADLLYKPELEQWKEREDVDLVLTVDPGGDTPEWTDHVGFVPTILGDAQPSADNAVALVCGPPIMIKFTLPVLEKLGLARTSIYTTLENRMKCGVGKCGRCNVGPSYVCKDGPVYTAAQLDGLPPEF